jgi:hypothetical protein
MPRIIIVVVVAALVWLLLSFLPLPHPFPLILQVLLVCWVIWELLALAGYSWPRRP